MYAQPKNEESDLGNSDVSAYRIIQQPRGSTRIDIQRIQHSMRKDSPKIKTDREVLSPKNLLDKLLDS